MAPRTPDTRSFWIGLAALLLVGVFLGVRTQLGVHAVLDARPGTGPARAPDGEASTEQALLTQVDAKAAEIEQAGPGARDPFRDPPAPVVAPVAPRPTPRPAPAPRVPPGLAALLYDDVRPSVQLRVGALTSDWLHKGESFQDWTVVDIRPGAVTVSLGGDTVVLQPS